MIAKKHLASTLLTVVTLSWTGASVASAQDARIGVANPVRIFNEMQEVKDLKQKLEGERARIEQETKTRRERIGALQGARDQLRPDSPQFTERDRELQQAAIEFDVWTRITQAAAQRQQKTQMVTTYEKIEAATAEVAKQKGLTVVFADQRQELPDNVDPIPVEQLRGILGARNVMYASDTVDISNEVIALLDTKYKSGQ
jgi:Skp family chaperone for outer membrane proteins